MRALCVQFNIINTLIAASSSSSSGGGGGGGSSTVTPSTTTTLGRLYHADGLLFGVVALGALGMFFLLQMLLFVTIVGIKGLFNKARQQWTNSHPNHGKALAQSDLSHGHKMKVDVLDEIPILPKGSPKPAGGNAVEERQGRV